MLKKKDYILIAQIIKDINARKAKGDRIIELFCEGLKMYPSFREEKFKKYIQKI